MAQHQLVAGAGHRDVAQAALLGERHLGRRRRPATEAGRQRQRVGPTGRREAAGDHPGQEDDRELEALRLVDGQHRDRVGIGVELGGGRVVARVDERGEIRRDEDRPVVDEQRGPCADDLEEPGDVLELLLGRGRVGRDQSREQAARLEEPVQQLAGGELVRGLGIPAQVGDEARHGRARLGRDAQDARLAVELLEHRPHRAVPATRHVDDRGQVLAAEAVHLGRGQRVQVHARLEVGDDAQEREQQPDLGPGIQPRRPGEPPRDAGHVERPQDRVGVAVGADEDRVVARRGPSLDAPADLGGDPVGLLGARREDLEPDRRRLGGRSLRAQALEDPGPHLEPVRIVEPDQPVGGVEDRRQRPVVPPQDHRARPDVALAEIEDVVDRGATERIDRLVVVADHGDVAVPLGERGDQLGLGAVRVLELVDQDVPEAAGDRVARRRRGPHEPERERDLIAEIDAAVGRQQRLVGGIRTRELGLASGLLGGGVGRHRARSHRRLPPRPGLRPRSRPGPRAPRSPRARCPRPCSG